MRFTDYKRIIEIAMEEGYSNNQFAWYCSMNEEGVSQTTVSRVCNGDTKYPSVKTGAKMIKAFHYLFPEKKLPTMSEKEFLDLVDDD